MSIFRITGGVLEVSSMDGSPGSPDNSLPGGPVYPSHGLPGGPPIPGNELPSPPGVWPPLTWHDPIRPAPGVPPGTIWPNPGRPSRPDNTLPGSGAHPGHGLPPGGSIDNTLPGGPNVPSNGLPSGTFWVIAGIPGIGWRAVCVDPSLTVGHPLPPTPEPEPKG